MSNPAKPPKHRQVGVPMDLYEQLRKLAIDEDRSISRTASRLLRLGLDTYVINVLGGELPKRGKP